MADVKGGFVVLWRSFTDWEWYDDVNTMRLFLHLVLTVNYETKNWRGITIERGSRICTIRGLSKELKMSDRSVRTALSHLISTQEVTQQVTQYGTLVTVVNYGKYQDKSESATQESTQEVTSGRHTTDTAPTHTKQRNKETKKTSNKYIVPEMLLDEWNSYVEMRKSIKKPLTDRAAQMALNRLEQLYPGNYEKQKACLNQSTFHCWQGLFELKEANDGKYNSGNQKSVSEHRRDPYSDVGNSL
jgi:hypothetical protein